jgi:hypothetical protein
MFLRLGVSRNLGIVLPSAYQAVNVRRISSTSDLTVLPLWPDQQNTDTGEFNFNGVIKGRDVAILMVKNGKYWKQFSSLGLINLIANHSSLQR